MANITSIEKTGKQNEETISKTVMPDLRGMHIIDAERTLEKVGLVTGSILYDEFNCPSLSVFEQNIPPYESVEVDTAIDLKVASSNPVHYLPTIYHGNKELKGFLWIFQHILNTFQGKLDRIHTYFNPIETTREFYKWLATWFSINVKYAITEEKMRGLIWNAVSLYQWRGTVLGLSKYLEIITEIKPVIIEDFIPVTEYIIETDQLIEKPILEKSNFSRFFTVKFPVPSDYFDLDTVKKIYNIIQTEKPAHTHFYLLFTSKKKEKEKSEFIIGDTMIDENKQI
ncbi:MAG: PASTA domain-containing protein [Spirochaetales bacterium]|nr:PASTA domain-containing protein [Spirochaetales bacterium]